MSYRFADSLRAGSGRIHSDPARQLSINMLWHIPLLCVQWKTPDDGQRNCPKHVEFYSKNKLEKLTHLVGFIIRIYHDARSPERQHCYFKCITFEHSPHCVQYICHSYLLKPETLLKTTNLLFASSFGSDAFGCLLTRSSGGPFQNEIHRNTSLAAESFLRS